MYWLWTKRYKERKLNQRTASIRLNLARAFLIIEIWEENLYEVIFRLRVYGFAQEHYTYQSWSRGGKWKEILCGVLRL